MYRQLRRGLDLVRGTSLAWALSLSLAGCGGTVEGDGANLDDESNGDAQGGVIIASDDSASDGGPQYLVYGVVYGAATKDCPEGGDMYRDAKRWYAKVVTGNPAETYQAEADALKQQMMRELPRQRTYDVESSSALAGDRVSHLVVIQYAQILAGRYCRPQVITRGYGPSYNTALAQAILSKEANGGKNVSHTELAHVTWTPQAQ